MTAIEAISLAGSIVWLACGTWVAVGLVRDWLWIRGFKREIEQLKVAIEQELELAKARAATQEGEGQCPHPEAIAP